MVIETRRNLLKYMAMGIGVACCKGAWAQPAENAGYVGIETESASNLSRASFFSTSGSRMGSVPLDFRAHGMAEYGRYVVVFPRRPGDRFSVINQTSLEIVKVVTAPPDRHFFGHGSYTNDGQYLLVTENDLESLQGSIGVYEVGANYRRVDQIMLPGAGPHEIARHPSRDVFFIALGGLETHPAYGRTPLNLHDFRSQIVALNFASGALDPMGYWAGTEGISLRHLAMDAKERLYIGGQIKSKKQTSSETMVWIVEEGHAAQPELHGQMKGYVSSVAAYGDQAMISSKESGLALCLDGLQTVDEKHLEGAGAVAMGKAMTATSGFTLLSINGHQVSVAEHCEFDNHGLSLL